MSISHSTRNTAKQNTVSVISETLGSGEYDTGQKVAILGEKLGVPLSCASRLRQSSNDLKMIMFGSDAEIVKYYSNYDSAVSTAEKEMSAAYKVSDSIESDILAGKDARQSIKDAKKEKKLEKKQAKAAERQKKAEAMMSALDDSGLSGVIKDGFGLS